MSTLSSYTGYTAEELRSNLAGAEDYIATKTTEVSGTVQVLLSYLGSVGGVNIGAPNVNAQIQSIANTASNALAPIARLYLALQGIGGTTTNTINTRGMTDKSNSTSKVGSSAKTAGGGGGGGGSSANKSTYADKLISTMEDTVALSDHARELAQ